MRLLTQQSHFSVIVGSFALCSGERKQSVPLPSRVARNSSNASPGEVQTSFHLPRTDSPRSQICGATFELRGMSAKASLPGTFRLDFVG
jgi:hypothetical protein